MPEVKGKVFIREKPAADMSANVYVRLIDTSKIDVRAVRIAESVYKTNLQEIFEAGLPFIINIDNDVLSGRLEIAVLADIDNDGKSGKGDYINKRSYPVLTRGNPDYVEVEVSVI